MKTALFFGSFNPIHIGHIAIAGYVLEFTDVDNLWFIVSPQNPLKNEAELADGIHRLNMVRLAVADYSDRMLVSNIEFQLPRPSYTIDTLTHLTSRYPDHEFSLLLGSDSVDCIEQWKNYQEILSKYRILMYPRLGSDINRVIKKYRVEAIDAPIIDISSTFIRNSLKQGKNIQFLTTLEVYNYLINNHLY